MDNVVLEGVIPVNLKVNFLSRISYLGTDAVTVFVHLCSRADKNGECYPSIRGMSETLHIGKNQIVRAIDKLQYLRYISINKNFQKLNHYFIMPGIEDDAKFKRLYNKYFEDRESIWYGKNSKKKKTVPAEGNEHIDI